MFSCAQCADLLLDSLYGLLDEQQAQALRDHLASCPACRSALAEAQAQQNLIARAAQVYAEVPLFTAPTAETQAPSASAGAAPALALGACDKPEAPAAPAAASTPPATLPLPPPARRRRRWAWVSAAAALLLTALGVYGVYSYGEGLAQRQADAARTRREVESLDKEFEAAHGRYHLAMAALPDRLRGDYLYVRVTGPANYQPSSANRYQVLTRDAEGRPAKASLTLRLVDPLQKDSKVFETHVESVGEQTVTLPAGLAVRGSIPRLEVDARGGAALANIAAAVNVPAASYTTHLATNRSVYRVGETLFFRSLTLDRFSLKPPAQELHLTYVLRGPNGQPVRPPLSATTRHGVAGGDLAVTPDLAEGPYTLEVAAAGAAQAAQVPPESRRLLIVRDESPRLQFDRAQYAAGDRGVALFRGRRLANGDAVPDQQVLVEAELNGQPIPLQGSPPGRPAQVRTDRDGMALIPFQVPVTVPAGGNAALQFKAQIQGGPPQEKVVEKVPVVARAAGAPALAVQFFPEGGDLVAGLPARVYFQALDAQGQPAAVEGVVVDRHGHEAARLPTAGARGNLAQRLGVGVFTLTPAAGESYVLRLTSPKGADQPLPAVRATGVVLSVPEAVGQEDEPLRRKGEPLRVVVRDSEPGRTLFVVASCRGRLVDQQEVTAKKEGTAVVLHPVAGARGVVRVTVCERRTGVLVPLAERLVYRAPAEYLVLSVAGKDGNKRLHSPPATAAQLQAEVKNEAGKRTAAWLLAVVVADNALQRLGGRAEQSPAAEFFLTRAVRHPEDLEDADILLADTPQARQALDLFLGTQGWRHFVPAGPGAVAELDAKQARARARAGLPALLIVDNQQGDVQERYAQALASRRRELHDQAEGTWAELHTKRARRLDEARLAALNLSRYEELQRDYLRGAVVVTLLVLFAAGGVFLVIGLVRVARAARAAPSFALACAALALCVATYLLSGDLRTADESPGSGGAVARLSRQDWPPPDLPPAAAERPRAPGQGGPKEQRGRQTPTGDVYVFSGETKPAETEGATAKAPGRPYGRMQFPGTGSAEVARGDAEGKSTGEMTKGKKAVKGGAAKSGADPAHPSQNLAKGPLPEPGGMDKGGKMKARPMAMKMARPMAVKPGPGGAEKGKGDPKAADHHDQGGAAVLRAYMHRNLPAAPNFPDTVFWDPLLPAADGTATLRFDLPGRPATYRVLLYGHDAAGRLGVYLGKLEAGR
jgi:hypothetical protein